MSVSMIARNSPLETRQNEFRRSIFSEISRQKMRNSVQIKPRTRVEDLVANRPVGRLEILILRRYPRRTVMSKGWKGSVAAACGWDETVQIKPNSQEEALLEILKSPRSWVK